MRNTTEKKVAIVGGAPSRRRAPYTDESWDIWAFSSLRLVTPRITRWFEMHAPGDLATQLIRSTPTRRSYREYVRFLRRLPCPVYVQRPAPLLPQSVEYPLTAALSMFGRCFTSTASYMIALAIMERYDVIGLWGIELTGRGVYARQRPGVEYLLGVARQRGIEVYLPPTSTLRIPKQPVLPGTDILYGYDWRSSRAWWRWTVRLPGRRPVAARTAMSRNRGGSRGGTYRHFA